jgi:hypothetical protein
LYTLEPGSPARARRFSKARTEDNHRPAGTIVAREGCMALRPAWKGFLKLSLVSVPVKAYTATSSSGTEIKLNQLHAECNSRINYKKTCPIHGEVSGDQIVSGYEYSKGQYVIVDTDELDNEMSRSGAYNLSSQSLLP